MTAAAITFTPSDGAVGTNVTVNGTNFVSTNTILTFKFDGTTPVSTNCVGQAIAGGSWSGWFIVPTHAGGVVTVEATTDSDDVTNTFTIDAKIVLAPASGYVGNTGVQVTGTGFSASTNMSAFTFNGSGSVTNTVTSQVTDSNGGFVGTFTVPAAPKGLRACVATDLNAVTASANYTVAPKISIPQSHYPVGTAGVVVTGTGFSALTAITNLAYDSIAVPTETVTSQTTNANGGFAGTFTTPVHAKGLYTLIVADGAPDSASTNLTTDPSIATNATAVVGQTNIPVTGTGFTATDALVSVTVGGTNATFVATNVASNGSFATNYTMPVVPYGLQPVVVTTADDTAGTNITIVETVSLSADGKVGQVITVNGSGWTASGSMTNFTFAGSNAVTNTIVSTNIGADGTWSAHFTVPPKGQGTYALVFEDSGGVLMTMLAAFTVDSVITLNPGSGIVGTAITIQGSGFTNGDNVIVSFGGTNVTTSPSPLPVGSNSGFSGTFNALAHAAGAVTVEAKDAHTGDATNTFTIHPALVPNPNHAINGRPLTNVTGSGFTSGATIASIQVSGVAVTTNTVVGQVVASDGSWTGTFTVPLLVAGGASQEIEVADISDGTVTVPFTIDPSLPQPAPGVHNIVGTTGIVVRGAGFIAGAHITGLTLGGVTATTNAVGKVVGADGTWNATFTVPHVGLGAQVLEVTDNHPETVDGSFTVDPSITVFATNGVVGTTVTVTGTGFTASDTIGTFTFGGSTALTNTVFGASIDAYGNWSGTFVVPAHSKGTVSVVAGDTHTGSASVNFIVNPLIVLNPTSGLDGTNVTVTGTGFTAADPILTFTIGGITPATESCIGTVVASNGSWSGTFLVPPLPDGPQTVSAHTAHETVTAAFNESTTVVGIEMVTEDVLSDQGEVMWSVTHALSGVQLVTAPAFEDEKVVEYDNSGGATHTETMQVEETSDTNSPGSTITKKIVVQHS